MVEGLAKGSTTAYDVRLDGEVVWPPADSTLPHPRIRTLDPDKPLRVVFGSCRYATPEAVTDDDHFDADALDTYAKRMARLPDDRWPDALLLLGDQVYADETSDAVRAKIRERRDTSVEPGEQIKDFEEYTWLYHEGWGDPDVRWLLSTIPSSMIFDDHDVRDDWNTSALWRREMQQTSWWEERIIGGLSSYWVYQHLGNLSPADLADLELYQRVRSSGEDCEPVLREFAAAADKEADGHKGTQWSYRRDLGDVRLLVIDSRCGRILESGDRSMVSDAEFRWIEEQVEGPTTTCWSAPRCRGCWPGPCTTSSPGTRCWPTGRAARGWRGWAEKLRRAADLEHWAAFRQSFDRLAELFRCVGRGDHAGPAGAARRRSACSPATSTTPTPPGRSSAPTCSRRLPADLLAGAQLRARRDEGGLPDRLEPGGRGVHPVPARPAWPGCRSRSCPGRSWPGRTTATRSRPCCWTGGRPGW